MKKTKHYYLLYKFFNNTVVVAIRLILLIAFPLFIFLTKDNLHLTRQLISFYAAFLINEIFIQVKVNAFNPEKTVLTAVEIKDSVTFSTMALFEKSKNPYEMAKDVSRHKEVSFFLKKLGISYSIKETNLDKKELLIQAFEIAKRLKDDYVNSFHLYISYILLSEPETLFMQENNFTNDDMLNIAYWAQSIVFENRKKTLRFLGTGVFDSLVYGWNYETKKYAVDFTSLALSKSFEPTITGRKNEYERMIIGLSKESVQNVLLVGEPGVGKTSLAEYFSLHSHLGDTPQRVAHKIVFELLVDKLLAGVDNSGQLEERMQNFFADIAGAGNAICFIQNIESIFGGGGFNFDMSGVLYEYLKNNKVQIIGTTTPAAFSTHIETKASVRNLFETIILDEPEIGDSLLIVIEKIPQIEKRYKVEITYPAVKETILLASSFLPERRMPGKAISLLEEAANVAQIEKKKSIGKENMISIVEQKTNIPLGDPKQKEKEKLLNLEKLMHESVIGQDKAVASIADTLKRVRSGFSTDKKPIGSFLFLGPTGVGKTRVAKALARTYFGGEGSMIRLDMSEYQTQEQMRRLLGEAPGEEYSANTLTEQISKNPFSLILLDEFEKAHPNLLNLFLQVFDDARMTDNKGVTVSFSNAIIIATSNAGSEFVREKVGEGLGDEALHEELLEYLLKNNIYKPELINRFDAVIVFKPLIHEEIKKIAKLLLLESLKKLEDQQLFINFDEKLLEKIASESFDKDFGARNVKRYIQDNIENFLSSLILEEKIIKGKSHKLSVNENNQIDIID